MSQTTDEAPSKQATAASNRYDRLECAGAFGDLGTLIPFLIAYITLVKVDPFGILFAFGVCMIVAGFYYRTPFPVQPMKAIGAVATTQAAQTYTITASTLYVASLATGLIWLVLGVTGAAKKISSWLPRSVAIGIILGLGISLMLEGIKMIATGWLLGMVALTMTFALLDSRRFPVMFLLLVGGAVYQFAAEPQLLARFVEIQPQFRLPTLTFGSISLGDIAVGVMVLALPQIPLTLGNAVIAITDENNKLFPHRPVSEKGVAVSTGLMNLFSGSVGGVPMCHGAGGMAGHVRFGAQTGGAIVILGAVLLLLAFWFSGSIVTLFEIFPKPILGVILFLTGAQLALGSCDFDSQKEGRMVSLVTAAFSIWNVGVAFLVGVALFYAIKHKWVRI